jgi:hypothetical protein
MGEPYQTRAAPAPKDVITDVGGPVTFTLIMDHGFRVYSEQRIHLLGVSVAEGKADLVREFVENWIAQAGKPSTLWITTTEQSGMWDADLHGLKCGWWADVERVALNAHGNRLDERHSLKADLLEHGLVIAWKDHPVA